MADVGSANIEITAEDDQARETVGGFMGFLKKTGNIAAGVAGGFALFETAKNAISGVWEATIGANAGMESYRNTLATVLKSWEAADQTLAWVETFAAKTPFEIPELVEATARLETYGITAKDTLGSIGDMASVMGKPLMQAVEAVADAQTGELERLKEFGITKQMLIDKSAEMGNAEVVNAKGQITDMAALNEALFAIMRDRYSGGMELQSQTFRGMVSNVKDSMGMIAREMSRPVFDGLKRGIAGLLPVLDGFKAYVTGDWLGGREIFSEMFSPETALKIENTIIGIQFAFHKVKEAVVQLQPAVSNLWQVAQNVAPIFQDIGAALFAAFLGLLEVLPPLLEKITGILEAMTGWEGFTPIVMGIVTSLSTYQGIMAALTKAQAIYTAVVNASTTAMGIWSLAMRAAGTNATFLQKAKMLLIVAARKLNLTMLANPFVLVAALLIGLGVALVQAYRHSETFRNIVNQAWKSIKEGFAATINWFTTTLPAWVASVVSWFQNLATQAHAKFQQLWSAATQIWSQITSTVSNLVAQFVSLIVAKYNSFVSTVKSIIQPFVTFFVNSWENLKLLVLSIVTGLASLLVGDFEGMKLALLGIWTAFKNQAVNLWNLLKSTVIQIAINLWNEAKSRFESGKNAIVNTVTNLKDTAGRLWDEFKIWIVRTTLQLVADSIRAVQNLYTGAVNLFNNLKDGATTAVNNAKTNIVNGFNNAKNEAIRKATDLYNGVVDWLNNVPGKVSEMATEMVNAVSDINLYEYGKDAIQGFINGIGDMISSVRTKVGSVVDALKSKLTGELEMDSPSKLLRQYGNWTFEGFVAGADDMIGNIRDVAGKAAAAIVPDADLVGPQSSLLNMLRGLGNQFMSFASGSATPAPAAGGPYVLQVNLNGRKVAEETYEDIADLQRRAEARARRARGEVR